MPSSWEPTAESCCCGRNGSRRGWSLPDQAINLEIRQMPDVDRCFQGLRVPGALFFHQPQEIRLASFDEKCPFRPCYTWLAAEPVPADAQNRRCFVHSLATLDAQVMFDGGWTLPMGQEDSLRDLVAVYRQLPAARFERVAAASGRGAPSMVAHSEGRDDRRCLAALDAVTVRWAVQGDRTYVYLVNDAPFSTTARVRVDIPAGCSMQPLGSSRSIGSLQSDNDGAYWWRWHWVRTDLIAAWFAAPNVRLYSPEATCPKEVQEALEKQLGDLGDRIAALSTPPLLNALENADFDRPPGKAGQIPGWTAIGPAGVKAELDTDAKFNGPYCVRFSRNGPPGALVSHPFQVPLTGRISLSVQLRVADALPPAAADDCPGLSGRRPRVLSLRFGRPGPEGTADVRPIGRVAAIRRPRERPALPAKELSQWHVRFELPCPAKSDRQTCNSRCGRSHARAAIARPPTRAR